MRALLPLLALLLPGCLVIEPSESVSDPLDIEVNVDFGELTILSVDVDPRASVLATDVGARVSGTLLATNATDVTVDAYLAEGPCPTLAGEPERFLDHATIELGDGSGELAFATDLAARAGLDARHHVIVLASAENAIGPIFGECRAFVRDLTRG